jgi:Flp pilus assembly protein TadD
MTRCASSAVLKSAERLAAILLLSAAAACPAPSLQAQSAPPSPSAKSPSSKSQKIANPLNDLLDEARRAIDANQFEAAITPLQKVIADQPDFAYAHFQLAYVFTALKKTDEARAEYESTIAIDPKMSEAYLNLGILLLDKNPAAAVAPLKKAVELVPSESRPRLLLGVAQERSGDAKSAAETLEGVVHLDPHDDEALLHLANLYLAANRPADAEPKFRALLELQPNEPNALFGLAKSLDAQKKPEAAEAFRAYLAARPGDAAVRARVIRTLMDGEQYDAALAELDRSDAGHPPTMDSLKLRADIQIAQKKWEPAAVTLRQAVALAPGDAQLHGGLGRVLLQRRDYPGAEKELKAAIELDGKNIVYWKDLSSTYLITKNYPATLALLDKIAKSETPAAGAWFMRALCYDGLNQPKPALEAYQKFLEMDENKNPDQVWQATERSKVLKRRIEKR